MVAAFVGAKDCVKVLLEAGADRKARDSEGRSARDLAEIKKWQEVVEIL